MALLGCAPSSILKLNNTQFLDLVGHKRSCYRAWLRSIRNRQYNGYAAHTLVTKD